MANSNSTAAIAAVLAFVLVFAPGAANAMISCQQVATSVAGCLNYVRTGSALPSACCISLRNLNSAARGPADRQQACLCLKSIVRNVPGVKADLLSGIPRRCGHSGTVALLLALALLLAAPHRARGLACPDVFSRLTPCLPYLLGGGETVPTRCCGGIRTVMSMAPTKADRQTACGCLKFMASGQNLGKAAGLPSKCQVSVPFKISPSTDCSQVN